MNALRTSDVIARVVAWHNRHPLARRIAPSHVQGVGVVALPFALKPSEDPAAPAFVMPIFDADWMYRAAAGPVGEWVCRHGRYPLPACADWPHRQVDADLPRSHAADQAGMHGRTLRHVLTAVIEIDGRRTRLLVAPAAPLSRAPVFGSRLHSMARSTVLAGIGASAFALAGIATWRLVPMPTTTAVALAAALPGSAAASAAGAVHPAASAAGDGPVAASAPGIGAIAVSSARPGPLAASAAGIGALAASAPDPGLPAASAPDGAQRVAEATAAAPPTDMDPMLRSRADGAPPLVQIQPRLTEDERRVARVQTAALRPAPAASVEEPAPTGTVYAIATLALPTRDDALAQQVLLQGLKAQTPTPGPTQLAVLPAQKRWRVVWYPHPVQREAERLLVEARARGLKVELIAF